MMRFTRIYLLYAAVFAWVNFPSNAFAAACSFPLTQTAAQSCDGLLVSLGQTGTVSNAGTITNYSGNTWSVNNLGTISNLTNSAGGLDLPPNIHPATIRVSAFNTPKGVD